MNKVYEIFDYVMVSYLDPRDGLCVLRTDDFRDMLLTFDARPLYRVQSEAGFRVLSFNGKVLDHVSFTHACRRLSGTSLSKS